MFGVVQPALWPDPVMTRPTLRLSCGLTAHGSCLLGKDGSCRLTPSPEEGWRSMEPDQRHMSLEKNEDNWSVSVLGFDLDGGSCCTLGHAVSSPRGSCKGILPLGFSARSPCTPHCLRDHCFTFYPFWEIFLTFFKFHLTGRNSGGRNYCVWALGDRLKPGLQVLVCDILSLSCY